MARLDVENLDKTYFGGYVAIKDVSFILNAGEVLTIYAKNGGGKSTLLKAIARLEEPSGGVIKIDGKDTKGMSTRDINVTLASSELPLFRHKSVRYNLMYPLIIRKEDKAKIEDRVQRLAKLFDIDSILDERVRYLDKGVSSRVMLARAFMRESDFYLFDNILEGNSLDDRDELTRLLEDILPKVKGGVIFATDRIEEAKLSDNVLILDHGNMADIGSLNRIYRDPSRVATLRLLSNFGVNEFTTKVMKDGDTKYIDLFGRHNIDVPDVYIDKDIIVAIKPEDIIIDDSKIVDNLVVDRVVKDVRCDRVRLRYGDEYINVETEPDRVAPAQKVGICIDNFYLFDKVAERKIIK